MKIYTRSGDDGTTSLADGTRTAKTDPRITASGDIDELNAHLGLLVTMMGDIPDRAIIEAVQHRLFGIGMSVSEGFETASSPTPHDTSALEAAVDRICAVLPRLSTFVIPGGTAAAAQCHVCRTVCRRAERSLVAAGIQGLSPETERYVNRLSDYLFALARYLNFIMNKEEKTLRITCK